MEALNNKRILIVEDEAVDRMLLTAYLERQGCVVFHATDGLEGIEKARVLQPDLILMDCEMPRCNGRDACKIITQDPRTQHIPVIFISGMTSSAERVRGLLAGALDYINKPFDFNEVKLRLIIHLRGSVSHALTPNTTACNLAAPLGHSSPEIHRHEILFHNARTHLLKSLADTVPMAELEKRTNSNSKHLNMAFKMCAGVTVYEYLREERMKEARLLLQQTQQAVQAVALEVGFADSANFATAFKDRFGLTPREFRQQSS